MRGVAGAVRGAVYFCTSHQTFFKVWKGAEKSIFHSQINEIYITKIQKLSVCLFVCLFVRGVHFDTQKSRDYINCSTGTRSEASEGPTSIYLYR